jgi:hypothetical protein
LGNNTRINKKSNENLVKFLSNGFGIDKKSSEKLLK